MPTIGININDKLYPFTDWIQKGLKTIETRNTPTLRPYIGKRVGIIKTGKGKAVCIGYMTIADEIIYDNYYQFYSDSRHCINSQMNEFAFNKVKYGYLISNVESCEPFEINSLGIVSRKLA